MAGGELLWRCRCKGGQESRATQIGGMVGSPASVGCWKHGSPGVLGIAGPGLTGKKQSGPGVVRSLTGPGRMMSSGASVLPRGASLVVRGKRRKRCAGEQVPASNGQQAQPIIARGWRRASAPSAGGSGRNRLGGERKGSPASRRFLRRPCNRIVPAFVILVGEAANPASVSLNAIRGHRQGRCFRAEVAVSNSAKSGLAGRHGRGGAAGRFGSIRGQQHQGPGVCVQDA